MSRYKPQEFKETCTITFLQSVRMPNDFEDYQLCDAIDGIQDGSFKSHWDKVQGLSPIEYDKAKKNLPTFCFNGTFKDKVANENFKKSSGLFHFDIDKLSESQYKDIFDKLKVLNSTVFLFKSPSGKGIKGAIRIDPERVKNDGDFKNVFYHFEKFFANMGITIDPSCKDIRRLCFVSYDPDLYINYDADVHILPDDLKRTTNEKAHKEKTQAEPAGFDYEEGSPEYNIITGKIIHQSMLIISSKMARQKLDANVIQLHLENLMYQCPQDREGWQSRFNDIPSIANSAKGKLTKPMEMPTNDYQIDNYPIDLVPAGVLRAAEALQKFTFMPLAYCIRAMYPVAGVGFGNTTWIEERKGLVIPVNSIEMFCGPTGAYKSSLFARSMGVIDQCENELVKRHEKSLSKIQAKQSANKIKRRGIEKKLNAFYTSDKATAPNVNEDDLINEMAELNEKDNNDKTPVKPQLSIANTTDEGAALACYDQGGSILYASAEATDVTDCILGKYNSNGGTSDSFFKHAAVGEDHKINRSAGNALPALLIKSPVVNGLLFVQYKAIQPFLDNVNLRDKGTLARVSLNAENVPIGARFIDADDEGFNFDAMTSVNNVVYELIMQRFDENGVVKKVDKTMVSMNSDTKKLHREIYNRNEAFLKYADQDTLNKLTSRTVKNALLSQAMDGKYNPGSFGQCNLLSEYLENEDKLIHYNIEQNEKYAKQSGNLKCYSSARALLEYFTDNKDRYANYFERGTQIGVLRNNLRGSPLEFVLDDAINSLIQYQWLTLRDSPRKQGGQSIYLNFSVEEARKEIKRGKN